MQDRADYRLHTLATITTKSIFAQVRNCAWFHYALKNVSDEDTFVADAGGFRETGGRVTVYIIRVL